MPMMEKIVLTAKQVVKATVLIPSMRFASLCCATCMMLSRIPLRG